MKFLLPLILFLTLYSWQGALLLSLCFLIPKYLPKVQFVRTTKRYLADLSINAKLQKVLQEPVFVTEAKLDLISYRESLKYDNFTIRRNILSILAFHPTPENMRLIKEASKNEDKVIRILARTALQQVEAQWRKIIEKLEERIKSLGDASLHSKRLLKNLYFSLGNVYEELILSEMLQEEVNKLYRAKLLRWYLLAMRTHPEDIEMRLRYAKVCNSLELQVQSRQICADIIASSSDNVPALLTHMEASYRMGNYEEVQLLAEQLEVSSLAEDDPARAALEFWRENAI